MKSRLLVALAIMMVWSGAIVARLVQLQVRDHPEYQKRAERQHQRDVELHPPRGTIFDVRGRQLAISVEVDSVWADPSQIDDAGAVAGQLAATLGLDRGKLREDLESSREFVWVARLLDRPQAEAVRELDLPGVAFLRENKRYYPMREVAAQIIGFAGNDNLGLEGLEHTYNEVVAGQPARRKVLKDARRGTVLLPALSFRDAVPGSDLHLTVDVWLQYLLQRELAAAIERTRAKGGTALLLNPNSGAVLAMASLPTFDPNRFGEYPRSQWLNRAVTDAYEPGSTFKVITAAAALGANLVDPSDVFDCENGSVVVEGVRIRDHRRFGDLTFREVIAKSSNVGAIKTGLLVGKLGLYEQIKRFGFGAETGVDLPGESAGILRPAERWPRRATAYIAFGQAISVTPLQLANAIAAVANGGTLYRPHLVTSITGKGQARHLAARPQVLGRPISAATALTLERLMEAVVVEGTAKRAAIDGYRVAGKTGTAQKAAVGGGYAPGRYVASFVGFAPARKPALVGLVAIDEPDPKLGYHGGDVAAPVFAAIVGPALVYLGVPPEREPLEHWPAEQLLAATSATDPAATAAVSDLGAQRLSSDRPAVKPARGDLPDFAGLTARQAVVRSASLGLQVALTGRGFVSRQQPPPGSPLETAQGHLKLWLEAGRAP